MESDCPGWQTYGECIGKPGTTCKCCLDNCHLECWCSYILEESE